MNLEDMKLNAINTITINDSLKAPLLKLNIKLTSNTTIPETSELLLNINNSTISNENLKTYLFELEKSLAIVDGQSDEFIIEPVFDGNKILMKAYVLRKSNGGVLLANPVIEEITSQNIILFEGTNIITTNYVNAEIEVIYPKNLDYVKYFLNTALYACNTENKILSLDDIYFKDCFTEVEQGINASFNKLTIKCMNSSNNNFSLDCDGNLVVNSITTKVDTSSSNLDFDKVYPVGSVYLSVNNVDPSTLFGGTWERITGYYLYAGNGGTTSGSNTSGSTALSVNQIPSHTHNFNGAQVYTSTTDISHTHTSVKGGYSYAPGGAPGAYSVATDNSNQAVDTYGNATTSWGGGSHSHAVTPAGSNSYTGGSQGHTHSVQPLRFELYCYKRVA